jgi:DNA-binding CsgD family transcriptional regulator/tetratricopeptide (TPR) repeat protein
MGGTFEHRALVGRDEQLRLVDEMLHALRQDAESDSPRVRAILLGGDAGMGKTTLVAAIAERAHAFGVTCGVGHCLDLATGAPFGPVAEALEDVRTQRRLGMTGAEDPTAGLSSGEQSKVASLRSLLSVAEMLGRQAPFVLVVEDLHWADASVRDFSLALLRSARAPILLVLTFRDDDVTAGHPLRAELVELARSPHTVRVDLEGLAAPDVSELVLLRAGRAPAPNELAFLLARSDGNPLYIEELVASDEPGVPRVLQDLLLRHVEKLAPTAALLTRLASVGGTVIDLEVLQEASELEHEDFSAAVHNMLERNVVIRRGTRFSFRHALLREAVHDEVLPGELLRLHAAYARALRARVESGSAEQRWQYGASLALHAAEAEDWPLALEASVWAGVAGKQYGSVAAATHFGRALELWDRVPDAAERTALTKADLPRLAARVLANEGVPDEVHDLLRQALDLLEPEGDPMAAARVYTAIGNEWSDVVGLPSREVALERAVALAGSALSREHAEALIASCFHRCRIGRYAEALDFATQALDVAEAIGADDLVSEALWERAEPLWMLGRCSESLDAHRLAVREAERADELGTFLESSGELAYFLYLHGSVEAAIALSRQVRETAERAGLPRYVAFGAEQELEIMVQQGRFDEAEAMFDRYCVPARMTFRERWTRSLFRLVRGDMRGALAVEEEAFADNGNLPGIHHSPRLIEICEGLADPRRAVAAAEAMMEQITMSDSPLEHAVAADYAYRALVMAVSTRTPQPPLLVRSAGTSLDFARSQVSAGWSETWAGMHLHIAEALAARLFGRSAIPSWRQAVEVAARFGRYTSLRPRLELAVAELEEGSREAGKDLLVAVWHEAHGMGAGWVEERSVTAARHFRVPLPTHAGAPGPLDRLTPREREVLAHVARGETNRAIAEALFITEKTASVHVGNVLAKLGVGNRGEAAALAHSLERRSDS